MLWKLRRWRVVGIEKGFFAGGDCFSPCSWFIRASPRGTTIYWTTPPRCPWHCNLYTSKPQNLPEFPQELGSHSRWLPSPHFSPPVGSQGRRKGIDQWRNGPLEVREWVWGGLEIAGGLHLSAGNSTSHGLGRFLWLVTSRLPTTWPYDRWDKT